VTRTTGLVPVDMLDHRRGERRRARHQRRDAASDAPSSDRPPARGRPPTHDAEPMVTVRAAGDVPMPASHMAGGRLCGGAGAVAPRHQRSEAELPEQAAAPAPPH
jgi:hypothetical protein